MTTNKKIRNLLTIQRLLALGVLALLVLLSIQYPLNAQAVTQAYSSDQSLQRGMLVQLKKNEPAKVEPVTQKTTDQLHGIVVDSNDAPLTISGSGDKTFVATTGQYDVLVSDQNGPIAAGDFISVSALEGIGMKAGTVEAFIVGRAITAFDGKTDSISTAKVKDSAGAEKSVNIARVKLEIGLGKNPFSRGEARVPDFLRKASVAVAGKEVSAVRIYAGLVVLVVTTIVASIMLYGAVRSAVISVGRNPLSKRTIIRSMFQIVLVSLIIFITGLFGVYLLLKA